MNNDKLSFLSTLTVVGTLAAMWMCRREIVAHINITGHAKERLRLWSLKIRGMQDYVGRHRLEGATA